VNKVDDLEKYYMVVPEEYLEDGAALLDQEGSPNNAFRKMIDVSMEYREANLTPVVLYDFRTQSLICIVKELIGKKLH